MKLFGLILVGFSNAEANFEVVSCNNDSTNEPEMTIKVEESYFAFHFDGQETAFQLSDGYYQKTIPQEELSITFPTDEEMALTYALDVTTPEVDLGNTQQMILNHDALSFECRYPRTVTTSFNASVAETGETGNVLGQGQISYDMSIEMGNLGGMTKVVISPNHSLVNITARLVECKITVEDIEVWPIHSFAQDQTCFDTDRLRVKQTKFSPEIEFELRTFRLASGTDAGEQQEQEFSCSLHIEEQSNVNTEQAGGCSCFTQDTCSTPEEKAVLVLSNQVLTNVPHVISFDGTVDDDTTFEFGENTQSAYSCGATINGEFWVFGGRELTRQLSKVDGCQLTSVGELHFDFSEGACNSFNFQSEERAWLCFDSSGSTDFQSCYSFNGDLTLSGANHVGFVQESSSAYAHRYVLGLGSYKSAPFVTGSWGPNNLKTELLDIPTNQWMEQTDYPYSDSDHFLYYSTASTDDAVYIIGGWIGDAATQTSTIARFSDGIWSRMGDLQTQRETHVVVSFGGQHMIIGGRSNMNTPIEIWDEDFTLGSDIGFSLANGSYGYGISAFLVTPGFCSKN